MENLSSNMHFRDALSLIKKIKDTRLKESTVATYENMVKKHIDKQLGDTAVRDMTRKRIMEFVRYLSNSRLSNRTIHGYVVFIKSVLNTLSNEFNIDCPNTHWALNLQRNEVRRKSNRMTDDEVAVLIDYCMNTPSPISLALLIAISTGIRIGELSALRFSDFDFNEGCIVISRTMQRICMSGEKSRLVTGMAKTDCSCRTVPLVGAVSTMAKAFGKTALPHYYVATCTDRPLEPRSLRRIYGRVCSRLGIEGVTFHGLRHTFASLMIHKGMDVKTVSSMLGHSSTSITMDVYCNPTTEEQREAVRKVFGEMMK